MRIGLDFDEVVADSMALILSMHNEQYGTKFKKEEVFDYYLENVWGGSQEESIAKVDGFLSMKHIDRLDPMAGAIIAIRTLKEKGHELYIVTGRHDTNMDATEVWIKKHFPDIFSGVHYTKFPGLRREGRLTKVEACKKDNIEVMIDDNIDVVKECAAAGVRALLFDQPWNHDELPPGMERVRSWQEILEKVG